MDEKTKNKIQQFDQEVDLPAEEEGSEMTPLSEQAIDAVGGAGGGVCSWSKSCHVASITQ